MSSAVAIAAVTATLKDLLNNGLLDHDLSGPVGSFSVTALPPDRITTGDTEPNQLNLFLYQVTPNLGWRNADLPSHDRTGTRLTNAPLALDLHYTLTAYGSQDLNAEILLGYAMQLLHETPVLTRTQLRTVLGGISPVDGSIVPSRFGTLSAVDLADQIELIKISPVFLSTEELSKMWTAMQARYRTTMAYMVSVVLIQATASVRSAPPVLKRGQDDTGPRATAAQGPTLSAVRPAISEALPAARLGDDLILTGTNLVVQGATVVLENSNAGLLLELIPTPAPFRGAVNVHLPAIAEDPNAMNQWAVGMFTVTLRVAPPNMPSSNGVPIALAPLITIDPLNVTPGDINLTVTCTPRLQPEQKSQTILIFGAQSVTPTSVTTPAADLLAPTTLTFTVPAVKPGEYLVRLRVQGIDSLPLRIKGLPAKMDFDPQQKVTVS